MFDSLTIVAKVEAAPEHIELVKRELLKLVASTLAEEGCLVYSLHQDNINPSVFLIYETWENRGLWRDHMNGENIKAYKEATGDLEFIVSFELNEMSRIA